MPRIRIAVLLTMITLSAGVGASAVLTPATARIATCDRVAAPSGSDAARGTAADPYASARKLVASLRPGETGCFRAGDYRWTGNVSVRTARIELASYPGEHAALHGRLRIEATADGAMISGLELDGRNANGHVSPLIHADRVVLRRNDISNHHGGPTCIHIATYSGQGPPTGVVIRRNRIHDCGRLPATNHDHGIYNATGVRTVIRDNWIYGNADRGVQLHPNADDTLITGNVIDGNGQGVLFAKSSDRNVVERNVIANSVIRYNVESSGLTGVGNVVRENCVWTTRSSYRGSPDGSGINAVSFSAMDNVVADPLYADPAAGNYAVSPESACAAVLEGAATPPPRRSARP